MIKFNIKTHSHTEMLDMTGQIQELVSQNNFKEGIVTVFIPHTTAGVTINEGADPDVQSDMLMELNKIVPFEDGYRHMEGNSAAHIKATLFGSSVQVITENGRLQLGTWQSIYFCEFDGPRNRQVWVRFK
ncbi:MAG: YjbQ family protein [Calditrichaeota bacterium]|nr:MAG: YjbQ family protein [Calditrichota bacterium]MBL1205868.1 YjbQ family protein [Calditrichota bacterium]NOG45696.1 YjbQ family protein [Calditrichota bacterium]